MIENLAYNGRLQPLLEIASARLKDARIVDNRDRVAASTIVRTRRPSLKVLKKYE